MTDITRFCGPRDHREWLRKPIRANGFLYATNGHIAIRMTDDPGVDAHSDAESASKVINLFDRVIAQAQPMAAIPQFSIERECRFCGGSGYVEFCTECDGAGDFKHGRHEYECKECEGVGAFPATADDGVHCDMCDGTGHDTREYLDIGEGRFAKHYLALITSQFPGAEIGVPQDPSTASLWRSGDVIGLLMQLRKD